MYLQQATHEAGEVMFVFDDVINGAQEERRKRIVQVPDPGGLYQYSESFIQLPGSIRAYFHLQYDIKHVQVDSAYDSEQTLYK